MGTVQVSEQELEQLETTVKQLKSKKKELERKNRKLRKQKRNTKRKTKYQDWQEVSWMELDQVVNKLPSGQETRLQTLGKGIENELVKVLFKPEEIIDE